MNSCSKGELDRRAFLCEGCLVLLGSLCAEKVFAAGTNLKPICRLGLVADMHFSEEKPKGTRYFQESFSKLALAAQQFRQQPLDAVIELGDIINGEGPLEVEKKALKKIADSFHTISGESHHVLGNHSVCSLTKSEFLDIVERKQTYYSFEKSGYLFIILDACFRADGTPYGQRNFRWDEAVIPEVQLDWLTSTLAKTDKKAFVFVHQCLDVKPPYGIQNAAQVRKVLEQSGKVLAVFQGHYHNGNYSQIGGIHYCTLRAMVEGTGDKNNAFAILEVFPEDVVHLCGYSKQKSYKWFSPKT